MPALVDSSVLISAATKRDLLHKSAAATVAAHASDGLLVPITVLAETMSFLRARHGLDAQRRFWDAFSRSGIEVSAAEAALLGRAREIDLAYADAGFGFADCTLLASCEALRCARVLSFDRRLALYQPSFAPALEVLP